MGGGRGGGSSIGDGRPAPILLMPDGDGAHVCIFESLQLEDSYIGDLMLFNIVHRPKHKS